ncbi:uncharacterized protein LOC144359980, partial [Saccoglossus kowalevskii]
MSKQSGADGKKNEKIQDLRFPFRKQTPPTDEKDLQRIDQKRVVKMKKIKTTAPEMNDDSDVSSLISESDGSVVGDELLSMENLEINRNRLKSEIIELLKTQEKGIRKYQLSTAYSQHYHKNLSPKEYGFHNIEKIIEHFSDVLEVTQNTKPRIVLKVVPEPVVVRRKTEVKEKQIHFELDPKKILIEKEKLRSDFTKLFSHFKFGLPSHYILTAYSRMFKGSLILGKYGYRDTDDLIKDLVKDLLDRRRNGKFTWVTLKENFRIDVSKDVDVKGLAKLKQEIIAILQDYPNGFNWKNVTRTYKKIFQKPLNHKKYGISHVDDLVYCFYDIFASPPPKVMDKYVARLSEEYRSKEVVSRGSDLIREKTNEEASHQLQETSVEAKADGQVNSKSTIQDSNLKKLPPVNDPEDESATCSSACEDDDTECSERTEMSGNTENNSGILPIAEYPYGSEDQRILNAFELKLEQLQHQYKQALQVLSENTQTGMLKPEQFLFHKQQIDNQHIMWMNETHKARQLFIQSRQHQSQTGNKSSQFGPDAASKTLGRSHSALLPTPIMSVPMAVQEKADVQHTPLMAVGMQSPNRKSSPHATDTKTNPPIAVGCGTSKKHIPTKSAIELASAQPCTKNVNIDMEEWPDLGKEQEATNKNRKSHTQSLPVARETRSPIHKPGKAIQRSDTVRNSTAQIQPVVQHNFKGGVPSKEHLNSVCNDIIIKLSECGEYVTTEKVKDMLLQAFNKQSLHQLGIYQEKHLSRLFSLHQLQCKVNAYIQAFFMVRSVSTAYELLQSLGDLEKDKKSFAELNLGPFAKLPLVYKYFQLPNTMMDSEILDITTVDIMRHLRVFMKKYDCWRSPVDVNKFMEYLMDQCDCDEPYQLGVKIQSIALVISVIKTSQRHEKETFERVRAAVVEDMETEIEGRLRKVKDQVLNAFDTTTPGYELRKKYSSMMAADVILEVFMSCKRIFSSKRLQQNIDRFIESLLGDSMARNLFQLAICTATLEEPEEFANLQHSSVQIQDTQHHMEQEKMVPPLPAVLLQDVLKFIKRCQGNLNLSLLSKIEKRLVDHFKFESFPAMGYGSFLEYIQSHPK